MGFDRQSGEFTRTTEVAGPLAGSLLLAHPSLLDANFSRSVVLLTGHSKETGSIGVILNRPLGRVLSEQVSEEVAGPLADVSLYEGGPVAPEQLIFVAWKWVPEESAFRLFFGLDVERATELRKQDSEYLIRGYLGHSGWSEGQLDSELESGAWLVQSIATEMEDLDGEMMWRTLLLQQVPEFQVLLDEPGDLSQN